jgi:hypothetical protein
MPEQAKGDAQSTTPPVFDLVKESRNVDHDGRAALLPFEVSPFRSISRLEYADAPT